MPDDELCKLMELAIYSTILSLACGVFLRRPGPETAAELLKVMRLGTDKDFLGKGALSAIISHTGHFGDEGSGLRH